LKITDALNTTADVESDIRTLCDNHNSRRLLNFLQEKIVDVQLSGQPYSAASEILDRLKEFLPNSTKTDSNKDRLFALSAKLYDGMNGKVTKLMSTGIRRLDQVLGGGFENGTLTIIAGRPGMGKTALNHFNPLASGEK
jgi:replicative DNA helicase